MERHHETALLQALDQIFLDGATSIRKECLYLWFNQERLTVSVYREILRRWEELCTVTYRFKSAPELSVLDTGGFMLNLRRDKFKGEELSLLSKWT
jgi:hypothetical protein